MDTLISEVTEILKNLEKYNIKMDRKYFSTDASQRKTLWRNKVVYDDFMEQLLKILKNHGYIKID